jgi:hypothetical protein
MILSLFKTERDQNSKLKVRGIVAEQRPPGPDEDRS